MSLLDSGNVDILVFLEETATDVDGNLITRPSTTGTPAKVRMDFQVQTGTSARRAEQDNEGYETEQAYVIRFPRSWTTVIGAQSQVEWNGNRWSIQGDRAIYNRSHRTAHEEYKIKRY
tara:strand:+ start:682 stop:1035 length:354 start_codon:yes stop_codon:yes gene_type:complete